MLELFKLIRRYEMADVHIGKIAKTGEGKGKASLIYHFDITSPVTDVIPTPISSIDSQLEQAEREALAAGNRVEVMKDITVLDIQTKQEIVIAIKKDWTNVKAAYNTRYNFEYKFFGNTIVDAIT
jgi:hypothetical protein